MLSEEYKNVETSQKVDNKMENIQICFYLADTFMVDEK